MLFPNVFLYKKHSRFLFYVGYDLLMDFVIIVIMIIIIKSLD